MKGCEREREREKVEIDIEKGWPKCGPPKIASGPNVKFGDTT